ncbi:hypothetical protein B0H14DRAFT_2844139, partial [Mycena olivaceomarginata]
AVPWWIRAWGCRRNRGGRCAATAARGGRRTDGAALDAIRKRAMDADIVWSRSTRRRVRKDGAEVEAGFVLRRRAAEAELAPVPTRKLARVWVRDRGSAAGRMWSWMGVPTRRRRRVRGGAARGSGAGRARGEGGEYTGERCRVCVDADRDRRCGDRDESAGGGGTERARVAHGGSGVDTDRDGRAGMARGRDGTGMGCGSGVDVGQYG